MVIVAIRNKAAGIDVHKNELVVTILSRYGNKATRHYPNSIIGITDLRSWVVKERCDVVAFESTGIYWYKLYESLHTLLPVEVANAYHIKHIPGKKTDTLDSEWIAQLALNGLIMPSRIFEGNAKEFRDLTRYRETLVEQRTVFKNKVHTILDSYNIKLSNIVTDIFGKSGRILLDGIVEGLNCDEILASIPLRMQKKKAQIREAMSTSLSQVQLFQLRGCLSQIDSLTKEIGMVEAEINSYVQLYLQEERSILMSVPGIGPVVASVVLSEIGDVHDFESGSKLAAWAGLTPSIYQSAGVLKTGKITKHGNSYLRWIMVEAAHTAAKQKGAPYHDFFERIKKRSGYKKAIVALARKLLTIVWHLLINRERYHFDREDESDPQDSVIISEELQTAKLMKLVVKIGMDESLEIIQKAQDEMKMGVMVSQMRGVIWR